ncbi:MAG TPA: efflux transporter outer membrane subunit [Rhodanobacteraceae bacterium]|nr:efflux transporter outer membrane subunit [Rhodanobacteraceae bacterium]
MKIRWPMLIVTGMLLAGCAAVPDKLSAPTLPDRVPLAGLPSHAGAEWPDAHWWRRYDDPQLNQLIDMALKGSTSLAEAQSRVQQAAQAARVTAAKSGLNVNASAQLTRQRLSEHGLIPTKFLGFTWYNQGDLGIGLDYDFDWWGKHQAAVESAIGKARAAQAQRSAAVLALETAVTRTWFDWLTDRARLDLARQRVAVQQKLLDITRLRAHAGLISSDEIQRAQSMLSGARQQQTIFAGSAAIHRAILAALVGVAPMQLPALEAHPLPHLHAGLPADAGIDLIARRPDIAASRWQVESALRGTDVARAQFLPDISIKALAGFSSIDLGKLLDAGSRTFALTPAIHLPIFDGGLLRANYGLSKAALNAAIAQYDATVVNAARDVATKVLTLEGLRLQRRQQAQQIKAARQLHANAASRQKQGLTSAQPALQAQNRLLLQRDAGLALHGQALTADVGLIGALGGGYRTTPPDASSSPSHPDDSP